MAENVTTSEIPKDHNDNDNPNNSDNTKIESTNRISSQLDVSEDDSVVDDESAISTTQLRRGKCKWFNVAKGWGFITPNDGSQDVFVHQSVIQMGGFRSLGDTEDVEFEYKVSDKGCEATRVTGPSHSDCHGSTYRPGAKRRFRKVRCYNCGEFANHLAAKCALGPMLKRCHYCKSNDHLVADCPSKISETQTTSTSTDTTLEREDEIECDNQNIVINESTVDATSTELENLELKSE